MVESEIIGAVNAYGPFYLIKRVPACIGTITAPVVDQDMHIMANGIMAIMMTAGALAEGAVTLEQAKQVALDRAGVKAEEVQSTKAYQDWDDGRKTFELEFWKGNVEYDMEVDAATGRIWDYDIDYHGYGLDGNFDDMFDFFD